LTLSTYQNLHEHSEKFLSSWIHTETLEIQPTQFTNLDKQIESLEKKNRIHIEKSLTEFYYKREAFKPLPLHTKPSWLLSPLNQRSLAPRKWLGPAPAPPIPTFLSVLPFQKGLKFQKLERGAITLVLEWHAKPPMATKKMDSLFKGNSIGEMCSLASEASTVLPVFTLIPLPWQLRCPRRT
jgi:hypothetical protein